MVVFEHVSLLLFSYWATFWRKIDFEPARVHLGHNGLIYERNKAFLDTRICTGIHLIVMISDWIFLIYKELISTKL